MRRKAIGTIIFEYDLDDELYAEEIEGLTDSEIIEVMTEHMVDDFIDTGYQSIASMIDMEIVND